MAQRKDNKVELELGSPISPQSTTSFVPSSSPLLPYSAAASIRRDLSHFANLFTAFGQRAAVDILTDQIMAGHNQQGHYGSPFQNEPRNQAGPSRPVPSGPPPYIPAPGAPNPPNSVQAPSLPNPFWSPGSYDVSGYQTPSAPSQSPPIWDPAQSYPSDPRSSSNIYGAAPNQDAQNNIQAQMMYLQWQQQQLQMRAMALASGQDLHLPHPGTQPPVLQSSHPNALTEGRSPVDTQSGNTSGEGSDEKRRRNTEASARFRQKKKERVENLAHTLENLEHRAQNLEKEATNLRTENSWLKEMVIMKGRRNLQAQSGHAADREAASDGDDEQD